MSSVDSHKGRESVGDQEKENMFGVRDRAHAQQRSSVNNNHDTSRQPPPSAILSSVATMQYQPRTLVTKPGLTLEEMLDGDVEDELDEDEELIPEEDIKSFLDKSEDMAMKRQQLRENLKKRFAQLCVKGVAQN